MINQTRNAPVKNFRCGLSRRRFVAAATAAVCVTAVAQSRSPESAAELRDMLSAGLGEDDFLAVDEAFRVSARVVDGVSVELSFVIADGYYLYRDKIRLSAHGGARLAAYALPEAARKTDRYFGDMAVYYRSFTLPLTLRRAATAAAPVTLRARYQGCADNGICYPPVDRTLRVELPAAPR